MENSQGNWAKPPRSSTMAGTAVARMVESMATNPTLSITDSRMGPRSDLRPTSARVIGPVVVSAMRKQPEDDAMHSRLGVPLRQPSARMGRTPAWPCGVAAAPTKESDDDRAHRALPRPGAAGGAAGRGSAGPDEPGGQGGADVPRHGDDRPVRRVD